MTHTHPEAIEYAAHADELAQMAGGKPTTVDCETCGGTGEVRDMKCYGGAPIEVTDQCPDCDGTGTVQAKP